VQHTAFAQVSIGEGQQLWLGVLADVLLQELLQEFWRQSLSEAKPGREALQAEVLVVLRNHWPAMP